MLDARLDKHPYLVNSALALADFAVASYLHYAVAAKLPWERYKSVQALRAHRGLAGMAADHTPDVTLRSAHSFRGAR
jgi:glutathione S-transferase